jgi:hypothetical protein
LPELALPEGNQQVVMKPGEPFLLLHLPFVSHFAAAERSFAEMEHDSDCDILRDDP